MTFNSDEVSRLYAKTAAFYDPAVWLYRPLGVERHRATAVEELRIQPGSTVMDLGTGTGLNLRHLRAAVGPNGRAIGVDISMSMLADLTDFVFPGRLDAALATFTLEMLPTHESVIRQLAESLVGRGRLALCGLKHPEGWPGWLIDIGVWLNKPFGVSRDYASIQPWLALRRHLRELRFEELYAGAGYLWVGEAG